VEPGGLVCRLPLPTQLTRQCRAGGTMWGDKLRERLVAGLPSPSGDAGAADGETARLVEQWSGNAMYMYRLAEGLISEALQAVTSRATDGQVSWASITPEQREMVALYSAAADAWRALQPN
jgi:hypothetical protein